MVLSGQKIQHNVASGCGGAFYLESSCVMTLENTTVNSNGAFNGGGAICSSAGAMVNVSRCSFNESFFLRSDSPLYDFECQ